MKALAFLAMAVVAHGQMRNNAEKQLTCENNGDNGDRARHCDIREQTSAAVGRLDVDAARNGGVSIKGWLRNDVLVRARVESWADSDSQASLIAGQVHVDASGGRVIASGPERRDDASWSVSYEIFAPQTTDLVVKGHNGGIAISDVRGRMELETHNGGIHLTRIAGDVTGSTTNGGVHVELAGARWEGNQLQLTTRNGGVSVSMPENYSAHIQTETFNGGIESDFPVSLHGNTKPRNLDFNVGSGGALIHVSTRNGGVKLKRV